MPRKDLFVHKLLNRLGRVDRDSVKDYLLRLSRENELYEEILQEAHEGILVVDSEGRLRWANRQAALWLGLPFPTVSRGTLEETVPDTELSKFFGDHLPNLKERVVRDVDLLTPRELTLRVYLIPLEGSQTGDRLILLEDISLNKQPLRWDERMAQMESLMNLTAGVAHEIGNPLSAISIHLELLKKEVLALPANKRPAFEKRLGVLNSETARLDQVARNFLRATRKPPLRFRPEDLNRILDEALHVLAPELEAHRVKTVVRLDRELPFFLLDRERLYPAFLNLIKNAMEAMPRGGALRISISRRDNVAAIEFKDEGRGIGEKHLPHIFDAYYTTKAEGSGLGLMTVFSAVRDHGGRIEVASKLGKGSTFTLLLPMRQPKLQLPQYGAK